jgi:hypothetical protein
MVVEQQRVEIVQEAAPCRYDVNPGAVAATASPEVVAVAVTTGTTCNWSVQSSADWITFDRTTASGSGIVRLSVAANPGTASRTSIVTIAGLAVTVSQSGVAGSQCSYTVSPVSLSVGSAAAQMAVAVSAPTDCRWAATTEAPWITVVDGAGTGAATVRLNVAPNSGAARSAAILVAGRPVTISQAASTTALCTYTIDPGNRSIASAAAELTVQVSAGGGCSWTASSDAPWIAVTGGASGSGNGSVRLAVTANTGARRSGVVTIAGETFRVDQSAPAAPCTYSIKPTYYNAGRGSEDIEVQVTTAAGCTWVVSGVPSWVTVSEGRSGSGPGTLRLIIAANPGATRNATLQISGEAFALTQSGSCTATIKPTYYNSGRGPDEFEIAVATPPGCPWTATSPVDWAIIRSGTSGVGDGVVTVRIQPNHGEKRTTVLSVAGERVSVSQEGH